MRIAFYYETGDRVGRNDGSPLYYRTIASKLFSRENVFHLVPNGDIHKWGKFDYHIWVDWGEDALMKMLPYHPQTPPSPNIYITSDTHLGYDYRLSRAREFDWVFCNQLKAVEDFVRDGIPRERCLWLPHAAEPTAYPKREMIKKRDVCFVGNVGDWNRVDLLDRMFKEFPNFFYGKRLFEQAAEVYSTSKIVLNTAIKDDLNMRVFEALSTGSFLLTQDVPDMGLVFKDGVHLVTFKTIDEAVDKARYYIEHDAEREKIAEAGYKEFIGKHTYEHRLKNVLSLVKDKELLKV